MPRGMYMKVFEGSPRETFFKRFPSFLLLLLALPWSCDGGCLPALRAPFAHRDAQQPSQEVDQKSSVTARVAQEIKTLAPAALGSTKLTFHVMGSQGQAMDEATVTLRCEDDAREAQRLTPGVWAMDVPDACLWHSLVQVSAPGHVTYVRSLEEDRKSYVMVLEAAGGKP